MLSGPLSAERPVSLCRRAGDGVARQTVRQEQIPGPAPDLLMGGACSGRGRSALHCAHPRLYLIAWVLRRYDVPSIG